MQSQPHPSEKGQAIVLMVLAMVVLLGFTALAVDGSMVYSDRRFAQSAADSASLAGGGVAAQEFEARGITYANWTASPPNCTGEVAKVGKLARQAGIKRAKTNSFDLDENIVDDMGIVTECGLEPIFAATKGNGQVKIFDDKFMDIRSMITSQTETAFAHFVYQGPMQNTLTSVTRVRPSQPLAYGYAIIALNGDPCKGNTNGVQYHGLSGKKGNLTVTGGGIWSNGCMDADGNVAVTVNNGQVIYFESAKNNTLDIIDINPSGSPAQLINDSDKIPPSMYEIPEPNCSGHELTAKEFLSHDLADPLPAGLYCIDEDIKINAKDEVAGFGVTLVLRGNLTINGGAVVQLSAPPKNAVGKGIPGVLIYAPKTNNGELKINGDSNSSFVGTILAPGANVDLLGNSTLDFQSQVIAWNVAVGGASGTSVTYNPKDQSNIPTVMEMYR